MTKKKVETWMPIVVDKYLGDTTHLSTEQHGAYLLLLLSCWKRDGRLPNDPQQLANIARLPIARWRAHSAVLMAFFTADGEWLTQKRLGYELERAKANVEQRVEAGKASAAKRAAAREAAKADNEKSTAVAASVATGHATKGQRSAEREHQRDSRPIPIPSSPTSKKVSKASPSHPAGAGEGRFPEFWLAWPKNDRKQDRKKCVEHWIDKRLDDIADTILADVRAKRGTKKWAEGYIEAPLVYLRNERWEDHNTDAPDDEPLGDWRDSRKGIQAKGVELGIGVWDEAAFQSGKGEQWPTYRARVLRAADEQEVPA